MASAERTRLLHIDTMRDGEHFAKFIVTLAADVLVKGHKFVRFVVEGSVSFDENCLPKGRPALPASLLKVASLFPLCNAGNSISESGGVAALPKQHRIGSKSGRSTYALRW
jgi:hypothetical protein